MRKKMILFSVLIILVSTIISSYVVYSASKQAFENQTVDILEGYCTLLNYSIKRDLAMNIPIDYEEYALAVAIQIRARVSILDGQGNVLGDSFINDNYEGEGNHRNKKEIIDAFQDGIGSDTRIYEPLGVQFFYVAVRFDWGGIVEGVTRIGVPLDRAEFYADSIANAAMVATLMIFLLGIIFSGIYASRITRPIVQLTEISKDISEGDYEKRVYIKTGDEIQELADTVNIMAESLKVTIDTLAFSNSKLSLILSTMKEAIIAIDNDYKIIMYNESAEKLFSLDESAMGAHILMTIRTHKLYDIFKQIIEKNRIGETEFEYSDDITMRIKTSFIIDEKTKQRIGILALIEDVSKVKKLENMRKDFVANVSHEMKTPLTSITGFIETLKEGAAENPEIRNKFLDIISIESTRLKRLIEDLLIISDIERGNSNKERIYIDIKQALIDTAASLQTVAEAKGITVMLDSEEELSLYGEADRFRQMIINLIENAIKYSNQGGIVDVKAFKADKNICITVEDHGIGISEKHLPRIFERFYRTDESRSKKIEGTGLGLAIVKHLIQLFGGKIKVESTLGVGTKFTVLLPQKTAKAK